MFPRILPMALAAVLLVLPANAAELHFAAAASLTDAVKELVARYGQEHRDVQLHSNFASSGALARQIAHGAPCDLFISANPQWMTYLVAEGLVPGDRVRPLAFNALVLVGRPGAEIASMKGVDGLRRIALGSPGSVPAGQYAVQALKAAGLYRGVADRLVLAKDVRQALVYADRGEVDAAFVYRTDARLAREAVTLLEVPEELHDPIHYPVALTSGGADRPEAVALFEFFRSAEAAAVLEKHGFRVP